MQPSPFKTKGKKKGSESQAVSRYLIKKALLNKAGRRCAHCYRKTVPVRLARVHKKSKQPKESDYILLCHDCIINRQEKRKQEKKRLWRRKTSRRKLTKGSFLNKIRKTVLERDNYACSWCGSKKGVGLGSLIPESKGGKRVIKNYVACCQKCRPSKGDKLPLNFIFEAISLDEYLHEELDEHLRVGGDPGRYVKIRFFLFSEISEFLHRLTNDPKIPSHTRTRAELLNVKLLN